MKGIKFKQFGLATALCALATNAFAASPIWVSNLNDAGSHSLRAAITAANNAGGGDIRFSVTGTIMLLSPLPSLAANMTVTGPGTNLLTISGNNQYRVFSMNSGTTNSLSGLTIANGMAQGDLSPGPSVWTYASGISNAGVLKLSNCVVRNCTNIFSYGIGVYNAGEMEMDASVVADCGGVGWQYEDTHGGGIYNGGTLRMTNCRVSRCNAYYNAWAGGGILNIGLLTMSTSVVESCSTYGEGDGGGIWNEGTAVICGCTVSNCFADFCAGGIASYGTLAMTNSTIIDNSSSQLGGGLNLGGTTNWLVGCTIAGNQCYGCGGGIFNYEGELRMLNCTVSGNWASDLFGGGGGIGQGPTAYGSSGNSKTYVNYCTIVSNTFDAYYSSVGGGVWNVGGVFNSQNSIIAGNATNDFSGLLTSEGYNLIRDTNGCTIVGNQTGNIYGEDPLLGPLQDNGGPTWTHALLPGSQAIDAGGGVGVPPVDQRGISRPQGLAADIGAFEAQYAPPMLACLAVQARTNCWLEMCGLRGGIYTLQASSNLVNWANVATNIAGTNGVCEFNHGDGSKHSPCFYRVSVPVPAGSVYIPAPSGIVYHPYLITRTYIYNSIDTNTTGGGRAEYPFVIPQAGDYVLQTTVNAPNESANSFYVNIDAEPQDPYMIWDIPITSGFAARTASWRGNGTFDNNQFVPKVFNLTAGAHRLIIRGREANAWLQSLTLKPYP